VSHTSSVSLGCVQLAVAVCAGSGSGPNTGVVFVLSVGVLTFLACLRTLAAGLASTLWCGWCYSRRQTPCYNPAARLGCCWTSGQHTGLCWRRLLQQQQLARAAAYSLCACR
jgi:hypothetical protein